MWWPNGYGKQPLYEVEIKLSHSGEILERKKYKIGLRTIKINQKDDRWGRSFAFEVNGAEMFAMGADYIPEDSILARCSKEKTEKLIESCAEANFNTIRVWGGGYYPEDYFYDLCDEYGLLVWQDLMYACAVYELTDEFKENIRQETIDNMRRIRNHASLGLWCGNNEMEWAWKDWQMKNTSEKFKMDYLEQFEVLLAGIAGEVSPDTFYWPASPSSGGGFDKPNDENYGDLHDWSVWHGRKPFTYFRSRYPRFMSEFGLQSFPNIKTIKSFTLQEDRNVFSYVMESHQKCASGNEKILYYISRYFKFPEDFDSLLYLSQLIQAEGVKYGVEHWRRNRGRCMGAIYWQLNDCWPVASWSGIDHSGRWKALQYAARRFFAPVLASAYEEDTAVSLHITNETLEKVSAKLFWKLCDASSKIIAQSARHIEINPLSTVECEKLDFKSELDSIDKKRSRYLEYSLIKEDNEISGGTVLFVPAKHFDFEVPRLRTEITELDDKFIISVGTDAFAKYIELDFETFDAVMSDNFFDLSAGDIKKVVIDKRKLPQNVGLKDLKEQLKIRSLTDSFQGKIHGSLLGPESL